MSARNYLDFDLQIDEMDDDTFRARVLDSPAGQAEAIFDFPFSDLELENFFLRIGRPRRGIRRIDSPEMNEARKFGSKLYKTVFQDALQACLLRSIDQAEQQGNGLRLRLRLPASLTDIPWEYLYDSSLDRFFSHSTNTPIVRYLEMAQSIKPLAVTPPLRVLAMIASPSDSEPLDVEAEWQKIEAAVTELQVRGLIQLTRLPAATLEALQKQLRREQYHIFHFVGHGGFDHQTQEGVLRLEDERGRSRLISGNALGTLLHDHPSLRLALLNACEGARTARSDPFAGVAQQLVRQGIPAVIAMQFEITDKAAILLAKAFYEAIVDGYPVESALAEARKSIYTAGNDIEWGTPVLYLRAEDGRLFDLTTSPQRGVLLQSEKKLTEPNPSVQQLEAIPTTLSKQPSFGSGWQRWIIALVATLLLTVVGLSLWQGWGELGNGLPPPTASETSSTPVATSLGISHAEPNTSPVVDQTPAQTTALSALLTPSISSINPISRTLWLRGGQEALGHERYADAQTAFERILAASPEDIDALLGLASALRASGKADAALITLDRAFTLAPDDPNVNWALGRIYREHFGDPKQAIPYLTRALEKSTPGQREHMYATRAGAYIDLGDYAKAVSDWNEVIKLDPGSSDNYIFRAVTYQAWGNEKSAERDYTAAIERSPSVGKYYLSRAQFYAQLNQIEKAVADYQSFLRWHDPDQNQGTLDQAESYIRLHRATSTPTP